MINCGRRESNFFQGRAYLRRSRGQHGKARGSLRRTNFCGALGSLDIELTASGRTIESCRRRKRSPRSLETRLQRYHGRGRHPRPTQRRAPLLFVSLSWEPDCSETALRRTTRHACAEWVDIDFYDGEPLAAHPRRGFAIPGARSGVVPILRMFGVTGGGNSVCAHVHGFTPYLWTAPPGPMSEEDVHAFKDALEKQMVGSKRGRMDACVRAVLLVPDKQSLLGYHGGRKQPMLQIFVATHACVSAAKGVLERGFSFGHFPPRSVSPDRQVGSGHGALRDPTADLCAYFPPPNHVAPVPLL